METELIGVPFDGYGRAGDQAGAAGALRRAGLARALGPHAVRDAGDLRLPPFERVRGPRTGLLNEPALLAMTDQLNARVAAAAAAGRFPVVAGGDCASLLGIVTGLRDALGRVGLLLVDGHEDTMPVDVVEDGEAANCEIGLLLGLTGRLLADPLAARLPALDLAALAMIGQRDGAWRRRFNVGSLADLGAWSRPLATMRAEPCRRGPRRGAAPARRGRALVAAPRSRCPRSRGLPGAGAAGPAGRAGRAGPGGARRCPHERGRRGRLRRDERGDL